jgi:hypothetical protein
VKGVFTDLLNANTWSGINLIPAVVGATNNSTRGATTSCIPNYFLPSAFNQMPSMSSAPSINFTGTCLTPSQIGLPIDTQVVNCAYVKTQTNFEDDGNGIGIEFTANQSCPTQPIDTYLANTTFVSNKVTQYFSSTVDTFKATTHTWSSNNFLNYALSTLDNSTLGATCSYVTENFNQTKNYLGAITFNAQPIIKQTTYPATVGELGYTRTFTATKTSFSVGFNTLIDFGGLEIGHYFFSVKETVTCISTPALNFFNFFWGTSSLAPELNFSQFTGSQAYIETPNMVTHGIRMNAGITTFHRTFIVPFVNDSTLIHSVRMTGIFSPAISSIRSDVTITKIGLKKSL